MRLNSEFYRLPLRFDVERLQAEVDALSAGDWSPHPQGFPGNSAALLIAVNGDPRDDGLKGPMRPTPILDRCPYLQQVLATFDTVLGRTRLMRLAPGAEASRHMDVNYYWHQRMRVHVPIRSHPAVQFHCGDASVHMAEGECWVFDTWRMHRVENPTDQDRVHLVADTIGSAAFARLLDRADRPHFDPATREPARTVAYDPTARVELPLERWNAPVVMSPWEQACLLAPIVDDLRAAHGEDPRSGDLVARLERFRMDWHAVWARVGPDPHAPDYRAVLEELRQDLAAYQTMFLLPNEMDVTTLVIHAVCEPALNPELAQPGTTAAPRPRAARRRPVQQQARVPLERPIIILAAPRSGSTLLFEALARSPDLYTIGGESHELIEGIAALNPLHGGVRSNRLTAADCTAPVAAALRARFVERLRDIEGRPVQAGLTRVRMLEKTPKNALRVPFLDRLFPDALFVYLYREPRDNISSIIDAWGSGRFVTYRELPGWDGPWSLLLVPEWRALKGRPVAEIALRQWLTAHQTLLTDLQRIDPRRVCGVRYEDLVAEPAATLQRVWGFAGIQPGPEPVGELPLSRYTLSPPAPQKWRQNAEALARVLPGTVPIAEAARTFIEQGVRRPPRRKVELRSTHTDNWSKLLSRSDSSLLVTTGDDNPLIVARADGSVLNTHLRHGLGARGVAARDGAFALATRDALERFEDRPELVARLDPPDRHDACFVRSERRVTGEVHARDMAWVGDAVWFANARYSCLSCLTPEGVVLPRWRPPFISALAPEDRCHLNGLAVADGQVRYVTAFSDSDRAQGWRERTNDGVLVDVLAERIVARGLRMPSSPRVDDGRLYLLEGGRGALCEVDPASGEIDTLIRLPGFARGLAIAQGLAFVGLSKSRHGQLTELPRETCCGVWVVHLARREVVAFVKFDGAVAAIHGVALLSGVRFPEVLET